MSSKVKLTDAIKAISNNTSETLVKKPVTKKKNDKNRWITDIDILQIKDTLSAKEIAEKYNVSLSAVYAILSKLK